MWGQMHEQIAIERHEQTTGNKIQPAGLYLFPCGLLGSTPDGIARVLGLFSIFNCIVACYMSFLFLLVLFCSNHSHSCCCVTHHPHSCCDHLCV